MFSMKGHRCNIGGMGEFKNTVQKVKRNNSKNGIDSLNSNAIPLFMGYENMFLLSLNPLIQNPLSKD